MTIFNQTDTSPCAQDYLPVSSDILLCLLDRWGIKYNAHTHIPLRTVADSKRIQNRFLSPENGGGHIKNLYLRDHKKKNILLVAKQDRVIDLKNIDKILGTGRLSFGSEERLMEHLGVRPGSVTPLSMITGVNKNVSLYLDHTLKFCSRIYVHPLVNNRTLEMSLEELNKFFEKIKCVPKWVHI